MWNPLVIRLVQSYADEVLNSHLKFPMGVYAAFQGIEKKIDAPKPIQGDAYSLKLPRLAQNLSSAIDLFQNEDLIKQIFPENLVTNLVLTKKQELKQFDKINSADKWKYYINSV